MKYKLLTAFLLTAMAATLAPSAWATTWYVNGVTGNDSNDCTSPTTACKTIGNAISLAASGDTVRVAAATYTENLTIGISLKILGADAMTTIIDGGGKSTTVVAISNAGARVTLSKLTIVRGVALFGGGISNAGTLTVTKSTISGNSVGGGPCNVGGGGIFNQGILTISNSSVSSNSAVGSPPCIKGGTVFGGGIYSTGKLRISNTTISGNSATDNCMGRCPSSGGGIASFGTAIVSNSTISGNGAEKGGGIYNNATLQNSIVANSSSGGNCGGTIISKGYNLSSDGTCNFTGPGDLNNTDPKLGPLQNNGGQTQTMALPSGSPAVDAGNPNGCTDGLGHLLKTDQRGMPRPDPEDTGGCDMGAYERQSD